MANLSDYIKNKGVADRDLEDKLIRLQQGIDDAKSENAETNTALDDLTNAVLELAEIIGG